MTQYIVNIADSSHSHYAPLICEEIEISAKIRGTGIAKRTTKYIEDKMTQGKAIIAYTEDGTWVGFCYIETWEGGKYVANSGLIVSREFRGQGIATKLNQIRFRLNMYEHIFLKMKLEIEETKMWPQHIRFPSINAMIV